MQTQFPHVPETPQQPYQGGQPQGFPGGQPYQVAPPPQPKRGHKGLLVTLGIVAVLLIGCIGGIAAFANSGKDTNTGTKVSNATTIATSTTAPTAQHFKVGDQVKIGSTWTVTINSAKTNPGTDFSTPAQGNTYLIVDITLKNISTQEQDVSSLLQFTLKDSTGLKYTETITEFTTPPDGKVAAGDLLRGQFAFEVPTSMHQFTFAFEADPFQPGQTIWDLSI